VSATAIELRRAEASQGHVDLPIQGMTCSACATLLEGALAQAPGIRSATVNFALERADVAFDPAQISAAGVADAVKRAGFQVPLQSFSFPIGGMTCSACSTRAKRHCTRCRRDRANVNRAGGALKGDRIVTIQDLARAVGAQATSAHQSASERAKADEISAARGQALRREFLMLILASPSAPLIVQMAAMTLACRFTCALDGPCSRRCNSSVARVSTRRVEAGAKSGNMDVPWRRDQRGLPAPTSSTRSVDRWALISKHRRSSPW
jgi:cation transport ATPase